MVWDGDVVRGVALLPAPVVHYGGQIREVSVQVNVLSVGSADVGRSISLALHMQQSRQ